MVKKRSELGPKGTCPCIGVLCFLVAFFVGLFTADEAAADTPVSAIKGTPLVVPSAVLGVANPYLVRAALPTPAARKFMLSEEIRSLARRADTLARHGLQLNQRALGPERLHLRFESRLAGGVLAICYRR